MSLAVPEFALTLTQPWATLVAIQAKVIETRDWSTRHRGPLAIHAAKGFPSEARQLVYAEPFRTVLRSIGVDSFEHLPTARIVAVTTVAKCYRFGEDTLASVQQGGRVGRWPEHEWAFGDFAAGRFGFLLENTIALATHVPARGMLNLWRIPRDVRTMLATEMERAA